MKVTAIMYITTTILFASVQIVESGDRIVKVQYKLGSTIAEVSVDRGEYIFIVRRKIQEAEQLQTSNLLVKCGEDLLGSHMTVKSDCQIEVIEQELPDIEAINK